MALGGLNLAKRQLSNYFLVVILYAQSNVAALLDAGKLNRTESYLVEFPYAKVKVEIEVPAASRNAFACPRQSLPASYNDQS